MVKAKKEEDEAKHDITPWDLAMSKANGQAVPRAYRDMSLLGDGDSKAQPLIGKTKVRRQRRSRWPGADRLETQSPKTKAIQIGRR